MAFAVDFYRQLLRALSGLPPQGDADCWTVESWGGQQRRST